MAIEFRGNDGIIGGNGERGTGNGEQCLIIPSSHHLLIISYG
ncbi:hypothetical protein CKA32_002486 [Geitlerinema sp. FC II]|nr:hypothetical protein CKA32_002486 [Geitlerinema sp. FC II]